MMLYSIGSFLQLLCASSLNFGIIFLGIRFSDFHIQNLCDRQSISMVCMFLPSFSGRVVDWSIKGLHTASGASAYSDDDLMRISLEHADEFSDVQMVNERGDQDMGRLARMRFYIDSF